MPCCQPKAIQECDPSTCFARFWMVLNDATSQCSVQGLPTFKHSDLQSARKEAARLANCNPGTTFYVLETVTACRKSDVHWYDAVDRDCLPF